MKYFVTGATGFIGGRVARQLVQAGHQVVALARTPSKAQDLLALGIAVHAGDVTDRESLRAPMTGVDGIFHIAGWYKIGARDTSPGRRVNIDGTRNVLGMMKDLGIARGVYTSTLAINGDTHGKLVDESYRADGPWLSEYDRTKWAADREIAEPMMRAGLPLTIVMPGLVYGPGDTSQAGDALVQYLQRRLPVSPRGTAFSWAHVDDIARAHVLAMEKGATGERYIVAGPTHTLVDAFGLAETITGIKAPVIHPGPAVMRGLAAIMSVLGAVVPLPEIYTAEGLRELAGVTYIGDNSKAKRELGYDPRPLEPGLRETLEFEMHQLGMR